MHVEISLHTNVLHNVRDLRRQASADSGKDSAKRDATEKSFRELNERLVRVQKDAANLWEAGHSEEAVNPDTAFRVCPLYGDYVIVMYRAEATLFFALYLGTPESAREWLRGRRVAVNRFTASIQLYKVETPSNPLPIAPAAESVPQAAESSPSLKESATSTTQAVETDKALFGELSESQLLHLGVPEELLPSVRAIKSEAIFEKMRQWLPSEVFSELQKHIDGIPYEEIVADAKEVSKDAPSVDLDTAPPALSFKEAIGLSINQDAFSNPEDESAFKEALNASLEVWRVFLHPKQKAIVNRDWNGPVKVTGGAGTGKTVTALHRARYLAQAYAQEQGTPIYFTTFTTTLARDLNLVLSNWLPTNERSKIKVIHIDGWLKDLSLRAGLTGEPAYLLSRNPRDEWEKIAESVLSESEREELPQKGSAEFIMAEYERVVLPQNCQSAEDYMLARRIGRGGQISRPLRKRLWQVFSEYESRLADSGKYDPQRRCIEIADYLRANPSTLRIRSIIVDEAQDISPSTFALLRAMVPPGPNDLFIVGDSHQRIYQHKVVLSHVGIETRGRSRNLTINYRTTNEIRKWAVQQLAGTEVDDLNGGKADHKGYISAMNGEKPILHEGMVLDDQVERIESYLAELEDEGIDLRNVCIVARTNRELEDIEKRLGPTYKVRNLSDESKRATNSKRQTSQASQVALDIREEDGVRLSTMHRVKGLEFDVIIIANYRSPEAYRDQHYKHSDAGVRAEALASERSLLHVAGTRAKHKLMVLRR